MAVRVTAVALVAVLLAVTVHVGYTALIDDPPDPDAPQSDEENNGASLFFLKAILFTKKISSSFNSPTTTPVLNITIGVETKPAQPNVLHSFPVNQTTPITKSSKHPNITASISDPSPSTENRPDTSTSKPDPKIGSEVLNTVPSATKSISLSKPAISPIAAAKSSSNKKPTNTLGAPAKPTLRNLSPLAAALPLPDAAPTSSSSSSCPEDVFVVYRVTMQTDWTEERFPNNYPKVRPPAQWSPLYVESHSPGPALFSVGKLPPAALHQMVTSSRDSVSSLQGRRSLEHVYDQLTAAAVTKGRGNTTAQVLLDARHSRISLLSRLVPSPDWFVGVSDLELCPSGSWSPSLQLPLPPLDAGVDEGLTFTSPRWFSRPLQRVTVHAPRKPAHPAAAFYYPHLKELPPIATIHLEKIKEYNYLDNILEEFEYKFSGSVNGTNATDDVDAMFLEMYNATTEEARQQENQHTNSNNIDEIPLPLLVNVTSAYLTGEEYFPKTYRPQEEILTASVNGESATPGPSPYADVISAGSSSLLQSRLGNTNSTKSRPSKPTFFSW